MCTEELAQRACSTRAQHFADLGTSEIDRIDSEILVELGGFRELCKTGFGFLQSRDHDISTPKLRASDVLYMSVVVCVCVCVCARARACASTAYRIQTLVSSGIDSS
jgi:hypothetical protein